ncbi:hypothetical protein [Sporomusa sp. KB1]|uniref:hypothetical protein n=1 Tax=Sporomusa sp. KB1 TaxID=943346 RepID=UPI0011A21DBC|nr:hypothetical protein [Sporomusa sp. KB1]TWH49244.1 hypothetical protein Salpa_5454 [Sporomusa sp. KB1]
MEYIIASSVAMFIATLIVYKVANNLFGLGLRIKPLLLCAVCAMFISLVLPKIVVGFAGLPGTLAVLAIFSVGFAYFVARCDKEPSPPQTLDTEAESACCQAEPLILPEITAKMATQEETNQDASLAGTPVSEADVAEPISKGLTTEGIESSEDLIIEQQFMDSHENGEDAEVSLQISDATGEEVIVPDDGVLPPEQSSVQEAAKAKSDSQAAAPVIESDFDELDELEETVTTGLIPDTIGSSEDLSEDPIVEQQFMDSHEDGEDAEVSLQISDAAGEEVVVPDDGVLPPEQSSVQEAAKAKSDSQAVAPVIESDFDELKETVTTGLISDTIGPSEDLIVEQQLKDSHENGEDAQLAIGNSTEITVPESEFRQSIQLEDSTTEEDQPSTEIKEFEEYTQNTAEVSQQMSDVTVVANVVVPDNGELSPEQPSVQEADDSIMKSNKPLDLNQLESEKLDDLIDFAFLNKESQDYEIAFNAFNKALKLYPNSEAAPFLVVEIGNILKNKGDYDGAINVFGHGRNLSQTKQDEMMEQEFICTIAYLRIIKNVLLQNRLGNIPFLKIPPHIVKQIDEEFHEWRSVGNI